MPASLPAAIERLAATACTGRDLVRQYAVYTGPGEKVQRQDENEASPFIGNRPTQGQFSRRAKWVRLSSLTQDTLIIVSCASQKLAVGGSREAGLVVTAGTKECRC